MDKDFKGFEPGEHEDEVAGSCSPHSSDQLERTTLQDQDLAALPQTLDNASKTNADETIFPIILAGGSGTRLWPVSRESFPKQYTCLAGSKRNLLQETVLRLSGAGFESPTVVTGREQGFLASASLEAIDVKPLCLILETVGRSTAPAIALAVMRLLRALPAGRDPLVLAAPADHKIGDTNAFHSAIRLGVPAARQGSIVAFGVKPDTPNSGYGYIERLNGHRDQEVHAIARFIEKPGPNQAKQLIGTGNCFWNSGIFLFSAKSFLAELKRHAADIHAACAKAAAVGQPTPPGGTFHAEAAAFADCPTLSIDYAVMEHTTKGLVVPVDMGWSDVGSWDAIWSISEKDEDRNASQGEVVLFESEGSYVSTDGPVVAGIGLKDLVVVANEDVVFFVRRVRASDANSLAAHFRGSESQLHRFHRTVHRPWGYFKTLAISDRFQVKELSVNPGASLSLQMHYHRAEHWVVVSGTAKVQCDGRTELLSENESINIPLGSTHRIHNPGRIPLRIIETQLGSYLGEDDIVRLEDKYGRGEEAS